CSTRRAWNGAYRLRAVWRRKCRPVGAATTTSIANGQMERYAPLGGCAYLVGDYRNGSVADSSISIYIPPTARAGTPSISPNIKYDRSANASGNVVGKLRQVGG